MKCQGSLRLQHLTTNIALKSIDVALEMMAKHVVVGKFSTTY